MLPDSIEGMKSLRKCQIVATFPHNNRSRACPASCRGSAGVLDLSNNRLSGNIPGKIDKLKKLNILDLSNNSFNGELPKGIEKLKDAKQVILSGNLLEGTIPADIRKMKNLGMYNEANCIVSL